MSDIESILSIIRAKKNDFFNIQIKAIAVEIKSLRLEVEKIAEQIDQV